MRTPRQVLGERGRTPRFLRTVHGQGYHFVAAVAVQEAIAVDDAPPTLRRDASKEVTGQAEGLHLSFSHRVPAPEKQPWRRWSGSTNRSRC